ncbi:hypothetical protein [Engelhardtia mirabilis]
MRFVSPFDGEIAIRVEDGSARVEIPPSQLPVEWYESLEQQSVDVAFDSRGELRSSSGSGVLEIVDVTRSEIPLCFDVRLESPAEWDVRVVSSTGEQIPDSAIQVLLTPGSRWLAPALAAPSEHAEPCPLDARDGVVSLPALENPNGIYWLGAEGYSWTPFRWSRRGELGHLVELDAPARLTLDAPASLAQVECDVLLFHPSRMWGERPLLRLPYWLGRNSHVAIPSGRHLVVVRLPGHESKPLAWPTELIAEPGRDYRMELWSTTDARAVSIAISVNPQAPPFDWTLWLLGDGTPGTSKRVVAASAEDDFGTPERTITWTALPLGFYALQIDSGVSLAFRVNPSSTVMEAGFDLQDFVEVGVYLPPSQTSEGGAPSLPAAEPVWVRGSIVLGDTSDWPTIPFPAAELGAPEARVVMVRGPRASQLRISYSDGPGVEGAVLHLGDANHEEVEPRPRAMLIWSKDEPRPPMGWLSGVLLERRDGTRSSDPPVTFTDEVGITGVGSDDPDVSRIYLPAFAENQSIGAWYPLPGPPSTTRIRDL